MCFLTKKRRRLTTEKATAPTTTAICSPTNFMKLSLKDLRLELKVASFWRIQPWCAMTSLIIWEILRRRFFSGWKCDSLAAFLRLSGSGMP